MGRLAFLGGAAIGLSAAYAAVALRILFDREFLPLDPGYRVDLTVGPATDAPPLRLAVLGDSTVAGVGAPTAAASLPALVAERVAASLGRPVRVEGFGVSGARVAHVLHEQLPRLTGSWDAVVVVAGSNDATHLTSPGTFGADAERVLAGARAVAPRVVLAGTPRFHANEIIPEPFRTVVDRYSSLLRSRQRAAVAAVPGARFVDIAREASPRFLDRPDATSADGFHPSPIGYGFWADALAPAVVDAPPAG